MSDSKKFQEECTNKCILCLSECNCLSHSGPLSFRIDQLDHTFQSTFLLSLRIVLIKGAKELSKCSVLVFEQPNNAHQKLLHNRFCDRKAASDYRTYSDAKYGMILVAVD